jgi:hypothetical protein
MEHMSIRQYEKIVGGACPTLTLLVEAIERAKRLRSPATLFFVATALRGREFWFFQATGVSDISFLWQVNIFGGPALTREQPEARSADSKTSVWLPK